MLRIIMHDVFRAYAISMCSLPRMIQKLTKVKIGKQWKKFMYWMLSRSCNELSDLLTFRVLAML